MSETYNHGVRVEEVDTGSRSIRTASTSIIGIVGTAPASEAGTAATLTIGSSTSALTFTAVAVDATGNDISVAIVKPDAASQELAVSLAGKKITISLATDSEKVATSTAALIKSALDDDTDIAALIETTSGGPGLVAASTEKFLSGGEDEAFPLDTPVLVTPGSGDAARLGVAGSLYNAISNVWNQADAVLVVVRVAQTTNDADAETITAVAGDLVARTGVYALLKAKSITGYTPRILIAPGFTQNQSVLTNFITVATKLRGMIFADGPNSTSSAAIAYGGNFDSRRVTLCDPWIKVSRFAGTMTEAPSSVFAGIQAGVDNDQGFWVSVSNKPINGIIGTSRAIDFAMGDTTSEANLLNAGNVATIINENGYRTWGSRTLSSDSRYAFANVARIADILAQTVQDNHLWAVDRNITRGYLTAVADGVNAYMRTLISLGALTGTQNVGSLINCCVPNTELNTPANIAAGKVYFDFYFTPSFIAEQITFRQVYSTDGLAELSA
jgi:hypothetical protein